MNAYDRMAEAVRSERAHRGETRAVDPEAVRAAAERSTRRFCECMNLAPYVALLEAGQTVEFRPKGNSMTPLIRSGQLVRVEPARGQLNVGDVVLARVKGRLYLHKITAIANGRVQISNNHGHINGWTTLDRVYGVVIRQ